MASNVNKIERSEPIRRAQVNAGLRYEEMSPMGQRLNDLAREIENSDEPAFSEQDIEQELEERRGNRPHDDENSHVH